MSYVLQQTARCTSSIGVELDSLWIIIALHRSRQLGHCNIGQYRSTVAISSQVCFKSRF